MEKNRLKINKSRLFNIESLGWVMLAGVFIVLCYFMDNYIIYTLNSDHSSELVMAKHLADEGSIISKNFYYSTVIKVVDMNIVFSTLFHVTDNWHSVRILGSIIAYIIILLGLWGWVRETEFKQYFGYIAAILLLPLSEVYFDVVLKGVFYAATIISSFATMAFCHGYIRSEKLSGGVLMLMLGGVLQLAQGISGPMVLVMFTLPLLLAASVCFFLEPDRQSRRALSFSLFMLLGNAAGFILGNSPILTEGYSFSSYDAMRFTSFNVAGIDKVINGVLECFGYLPGEEIFSTALLPCAAAGLWLLLSLGCSVYMIIKKENYSFYARLMGGLLLGEIAVLLLVFTMSSTYYNARYTIMAVLLGVPAVFACLSKVKRGKNILLAMTALSLLCGALNYNDMRKVDLTYGQREAIDAIVEQGYSQGYASFWNGNVITELSNGGLEVWHWSDNKQAIEDLEEFNKIYPWLQEKSHLEAPPEGRFFILLSCNEDYYYGFTKKLDAENVIYKAANYDELGIRDYIVYGFESYDEFEDQMTS